MDISQESDEHPRKKHKDSYLEDAIKVVAAFKASKDSQHNVAHQIVHVIGIVTRIFQFVDFEQRKRNSSNDLSSENEKRKSNSFLVMGSPFFENTLEKVRVSDSTDISSIVDQKDSPYHFWQRRNPDYSETEGQNSSSPTRRTATIWGMIEEEKKALKSLNQSIRVAASEDNIERMQELIAERVVRADGAVGLVEKLISHLDSVARIHEERRNDLLDAISRLEEVQHWLEREEQLVSQEFKSQLIQRLEASEMKWDEIVKQGSKLVADSGGSKLHELTRMLSDNMKAIAAVTVQLSDWLVNPDIHYLDNSIVPFESMHEDEDYEMTIPTTCNVEESAQRVSDSLRELHDTQQNLCYSILEFSKTEMNGLDESKLDSFLLLSLALKQGLNAIQKANTENTITCLEISKMREDLDEWMVSLSYWKDPNKLKEKCDELVREAHQLEDNLVANEDARIDLKSSLEKAVLKNSRGKMITRSTATSTTASSEVNEIDKLKAELCSTERASKVTRRLLRNWYRENRKFALNVAGELFHRLPDFRSPGSVLGDGGFAEIAKIPHRNLSDYDDVTPFVDMKNQEGQTGRHLLLCANYEGEDVMLKGFVMHNHDQRKGMDREIAILSKLKSDMIISPRAIVDASDDSSLDPSLSITLFIEYPFYKGGNLSSWLKSGEKKPWELQAMARQLLYALMYLHDHGVIHRVRC